MAESAAATAAAAPSVERLGWSPPTDPPAPPRTGLRRGLSRIAGAASPRKERSVARTLGVAFGLLILLLLLSGVAGLVATVRIRSSSQHLLDVVGPAGRANRDVLQGMTNAETGVRGYAGGHDRTFLPVAVTGLATVSPGLGTMGRLLGREPTLARLLAAERTASTAWITQYANPVIAGQKLSTLDGKHLFDTFRATNSAAGVYTDRLRTSAIDSLHETIVVTIALIGGCLVVGLLVGVRTAVSTTRRFVEPLNGVTTAVVALAKGCLTFRLTPAGPTETRAVGRSINVLADKLQRVDAERATATRLIEDANAQLVTANDELEAFSYSVSHDLRAPLRAMDGFSQILLDDYAAQIPEEAAGYLRRVRAGAVRMSDLIDALLALAHLGRQELVVHEVDPTDIARQAVVDLADVIGDRNVEMTIAELPPCRADPTLLGQVYANLLSNALKYSRGRDPAVIHVGSREESGHTVYYVADNGAGFDEEHAGKMFGVFQRMHTSDQFEGIGIGLALAQRIVSRHGGRIWATGHVDQGATFSFTLGEEDQA